MWRSAGIIACGVVSTLIGLIVMAIGTRWIETLMPPVVTGAVVAVIGLNLAPIAVKGVTANNFDAWMALVHGIVRRRWWQCLRAACCSVC